MKDPEYLNKFIRILLKFWRESYAVISGIEQLYHEIKVAGNDQGALWFAWRDNTDKEIVDHIIKVHIFGRFPLLCNLVYKKG